MTIIYKKYPTNYSLINKAENEIHVNLFNEVLVSAEIDDKWGYINQKGETVIKHQYDQATAFLNDLVIVEIDGKFYLISKDGK